jgi:hypothetical protein
VTASELASGTPITAVWELLGGPKPVRGRARAFYRGGENSHAVSLNDTKGCWYDFAANLGGGILDLVQHVLGIDRQNALRWLADSLGVQLDSREFTEADKCEFARSRRLAERDAQNAHWFVLAAIAIVDEALAEAKPYDVSRAVLTRLAEALRSGEAVKEYRAWAEHSPELTAAVVRAGRGYDERISGCLRVISRRRMPRDISFGARNPAWSGR